MYQTLSLYLIYCLQYDTFVELTLTPENLWSRVAVGYKLIDSDNITTNQSL